ncbi:hypothetical protein [Winogradskyella sp. SYSU M77433]|uniref:hypothetical protein n=1 Tax=Winogradskyella sp. SYSU M77433 TaxID=3042722 RepID=UPI002480176C|nr:hypothetical protein [Winogradskyella sp. SYSU M77433]MDH7912792.1 hypothetical protein [Winogradskyella sp. SYSU M77433]
MALFNLDIERYYQAKNEEGFELKSIAYLQYPIYCIHATILDSTPDPLEKLDKAIIKCILLNNEMSILDIAQFLSVQKRGVELRVEQMKSEGLIKGENRLNVTELGRDILIFSKEKRLQKRQHNFYLDGVDFKPLSSELYSAKYLKSFFNENEFTYYTNSRGVTKSYKPFKPNIVHEPLIKEKVLENIFNIPINERESWAIPLGLEEIETIDFTKMSMPVLVGLLKKENKLFRELLDPLNVTGDSTKINSIESKIYDKIQKIELRINTWIYDEKENFSFASNWTEIDKEIEGERLQFVTNEDLKKALKEIYFIETLSDVNIINTDFEIGLNVTEELIHNIKSNRREFLGNLLRTRDAFIDFSTSQGIWVVFIKFITESEFVKALMEIFYVLKTAKTKGLKDDDVIQKLLGYDIYRKALIFLEEFELLEKIDIKQHMHIEELVNE